MTAEEHLARAEAIIDHLDNPDNVVDIQASAAGVQIGIAHALMAVAIELGVPHASADSYGADHAP